ncbi:prenyltransferase/squalene oxidase repeat-containing protein [Streptomyces canus]|uniref:prenyltransferase/squalene oxidase repeat-containing protein n=1 Tax=Streptomyces canus TaxID=58343 RepID=UPI00386D7F04|nr:prenyltransferase [Streptomyces canus]
MIASGARPPAQVRRAIDSAAQQLFAVRRPDGSWQDHLPSAAISTATSAVALHFADPEGSAELIGSALDWLRANQLPTGGWGDGPGTPATLPASAFAVAALRLLAAEESRQDVRRGLDWIESRGGMAAVADPDRCALHVLCLQFLALAGLYDERRIRRMPAAVALLPRKLRQKVSFVVPVTLSWAVMQRHTWPQGRILRAVSRLAEPRAYAYFDELLLSQGKEGGMQESPLLVSMVCFAFARAGVRPDLVERMAGYLRLTARPDGSWAVNRDLEFSVTTFLAAGLQECGFADDPRLSSTIDWIRTCQWDAGFMATGCPPGGWAWSVESGWPNCDDTADALLALAGAGCGPTDPRVRAGLDWLLAMQNRDGSWSCFCRDNHVALDAPCAVITSHAVAALRLAGGLGADAPPLAKAVRWFAKTQRPDGSLPCLWYRGSTAGTGQVLDALGGLGLGGSDTARRARTWLLRTQQPDGGWGDGEGAPSSVEETAWAVMGLLGAGADPREEAVQGGVRRLLHEQTSEALWEPTLLGVYFLDLWYSDDLLASGYALQALGRYWKALT